MATCQDTSGMQVADQSNFSHPFLYLSVCLFVHPFCRSGHVLYLSAHPFFHRSEVHYDNFDGVPGGGNMSGHVLYAGGGSI